MAKSPQEYFDLVEEIESEMSFNFDYLRKASKKGKEFMQKEMNKIADKLIEKVEKSEIPNERKSELIKITHSKLEEPEKSK